MTNRFAQFEGGEFDSTSITYSFDIGSGQSLWDGTLANTPPTPVFLTSSKAALSTAEQTRFSEAIALWDAYSAFSISITTGKGDINAYHADLTGHGGTTGTFGTETQTSANNSGTVPHARAETVINSSLSVTSQFGFYMALHEIGHALGLTHPSTGEFDSNYDTYQTVMSYNAPTVVGATVAVDHYAVTPMAYDIAALQELYGSFTRNTGNTTYDATALGVTGSGMTAQTIVDTGGTDTIDLSGVSGNHVIDLRQALDANDQWTNARTVVAATFAGASTGHEYIYIAQGTDIEIAIGGAGDDKFIGVEGVGNEFYGNGGNNTVDYSHASNAVTGNLDAVTVSNDGGGGVDYLINIQNVIGSAYDDDLYGTIYANRFYGGDGIDTLAGNDGNDWLAGGNGNDILDGGYDEDVADYDGAASAVTVNLATGTASDGAGGTDTLIDIEAARGSSYNDTFYGSYNPDRFYGSAGNDVVSDPGGTNWADYSLLAAGITVTSTGSQTFTVVKGASGVIGTDSLAGIDSIDGTKSNDTFSGSYGPVWASPKYDGGDGSDLYQFNITANAGAGSVIDTGLLGIDKLIISSFNSPEIHSYQISRSGSTLGFNFTVFNDASHTTTHTYGVSTWNDGAAGVELIEVGGILYSAADFISYFQDTGTTNTNNIANIVSYKYVDAAYGGGGGMLPTLSGGAVTEMEYSASYGGIWVPHAYATEIFHAPVLDSVSITGTNLSIATESYAKEIAFSSGISLADLRFTLAGTIGDTDLVIHIDSLGESFTIPDFEVGKTISGVGFYDAAMHTWIQSATGMLTDTGDGTFSGAFSGSTTPSFSSSSVNATYLLEAVSAVDGSINMQGALTFKGTSAGETLLGLDVRGDTIMGLGGNDTLYGYGGGDVLLGGDGSDSLFGGNGNDALDGGSGDDAIAGDGGTDTATYVNASSAITINLATTTAQNTVGAGLDTITGIENLIGSVFGDTLTGDGASNSIEGGTGNDTLDGAGGSDTVIYSSASVGVSVNLSVSAAQDTLGAGTDTLSNFENLLGSAFDDTLTGDNTANVIDGSDGNDLIEGAGGNDTLSGGGGIDTLSYKNAGSAVTVNLATTTGQNTVGAGTDTLSGFENLVGSTFNDTLTGDGNDNLIEGGAGNDSIDGAGGTDTLTYTSASAGVTVNLATAAAQNTVGAGTDTLSDFENLTGSAFGDTLTGNASDNIIDGGYGDDVIEGAAGNDTLTGGAGTDTLSYKNAGSAVTANLATATAQNTVGAGTDTISGFENLLGSAFNDTLTGDGSTNFIEGGLGNDTMNGAGGNDTLSYASATAGITMNIATATAQATGGAGSDTVSNFENILGSAFNDTLTGNTAVNIIDGGAGNDTIQGGTGNDTLIGGLGTDKLTYAAAASAITVSLALGSAQSTGGAGTDTISGFEDLTGSASADTLSGDANANVIDGGAGNDTIDGGAGNDTLTGGSNTDTVTFASATSGVTVNLATTTAQNTVGAGTDTISGFEKLTGSAYADVLTGDSGANTITGGDGDDTIQGGAGNDTLTGGNGTDTLSYAAAASAVTANLATATAQNTVGAGSDTISGFENLTGSAFNDTLTGNSSANTIHGGTGTNSLTGGGGADIFAFDPAVTMNNIQDFSTAQSDKLDISSLIEAYDPLTHALTDFVQITTSGANSSLFVDQDGLGATYGLVQVGSILGVTGLTDEAALVAAGTLIV